jgi:BirA family biotin operon repressor/biotin-[acetyl-CoA-carboxylase] ligase
MAGAESVSRAQFAAELTRELDAIFLEEDWLHTHPEEALKELRERSCTIGSAVTVISCDCERRGQALDIAPDGGLLVAYEDGSREIVSSGEVSVRGILGYLPEQAKGAQA